jgi:predicted aspartyl protease
VFPAVFLGTAAAKVGRRSAADSADNARVADTVGKLSAVHPGAAGGCFTPSDNHRLCLTDSITGMTFLIDTGANVSVLPVNRCSAKDRRECKYKLYAANNSEIKTYGTVVLELALGLRRLYKWQFILCDVQQPIIGADFLKTHKLTVDLHNRKLLDSVTNLCSIGSIVCFEQASVKSIQDDNPYRDILEQYADITRPISFREPSKTKVKHYIETSGPPVYARARPLPRDRYEKVKQEFRHMQELGICRPSKSPWASPLHVVPKKDGQIRPCGDYRRLNAVTKPDRYPIPRLQDFTYGLSGKNFFSTLDITRAYHAIEIAPEDVEKSAVITPFGLFEFTRLCFGLRNAAQTFQRFMNAQLQDIENFTNEAGEQSSLFCYIDDIIIASSNERVHKEHLSKLFENLSKVGLTINLSKCQFGLTQVDFLGYTVSAQGLRPRDDKDI